MHFKMYGIKNNIIAKVKIKSFHKQKLIFYTFLLRLFYFDVFTT